MGVGKVGPALKFRISETLGMRHSGRDTASMRDTLATNRLVFVIHFAVGYANKKMNSKFLTAEFVLQSR